MICRPKSAASSCSIASSSTSRENTYTPIDAMNGLSAECPVNIAPSGMLRPISSRRARFGFSFERHDLPVVLEPEDAHRRRVIDRHRLRRDR
jgi:hypothetical protein